MEYSKAQLEESMEARSGRGAIEPCSAIFDNRHFFLFSLLSLLPLQF